MQSGFQILETLPKITSKSTPTTIPLNDSMLKYTPREPSYLSIDFAILKVKY